MSSCCPPKHDDHHGPKDGHEHGHDHSRKIDPLFVGTSLVVLVGVILHFSSLTSLPDWVEIFSHTIVEFLGLVWWGILLGVFFVGVLNFVPREAAFSLIGKPGQKKSIIQAALAGLLFDLCSHGILLVGLKFYERGASLGQVMAFLIASPWNSLSLTVILVALIGFKWTLLFIAASFVIAILSGYIFDFCVAKGVLPQNPNQQKIDTSKTLKDVWAGVEWTKKAAKKAFVSAFHESKMIIRWIFVGVIAIALVRAFVDLETFQTLFAPTLLGLGLTLAAATVIEVCSEGLAPIATDLLTKAAAPGNAFAFLMAGVATDYTEILGIRETTKSWKIALFLPLITVPQIVFFALIMNGTILVGN